MSDNCQIFSSINIYNFTTVNKATGLLMFLDKPILMEYAHSNMAYLNYEKNF